MSSEERTKKKVSFDQIPLRQRESLEKQLPKENGCLGCLVWIIIIFVFYKILF